MPAAKDTKTKILRNLTVWKAGFVNRGANQHAFVGLLKEAGAGEEPPVTVDDVMQEQEFWDLWYDLRSALEESVRSILESGGDNTAQLLQESVQQFVDRLLAVKVPATKAAGAPALEVIDATLASFLTDAAKPGTVWSLDALQKTLNLCESEAHAPAQQVKENTMDKATLLKMLGDEKATLTKEQRAAILKMVTDAEAGATAAADAVKKAQDGAKAATDELATVAAKVTELEKAAGDVKCPKCGAMVPTAKAAPTSAKEQELQKRLDSLEDKDLDSTVTALVKDLGLPGDGKKVHSVLKTVIRALPGSAEDLKEVLKAASATKAELALLQKNLGRATNADDVAEPAQKVASLVKAARAADPKLDAVTAEAKVYKDNPELADEIRTAEAERARQR